MATEYADSHGHLTMLFEGGEMKGAPRDPTAAEVKELVSRAWDAGVTRILVPGTHRGDLRLAVEIAEQYEGVYAAVGIHPHEAKEFDEDEDLKLFEELSASKKVVAVGEIGLDYHYDHSPKEAQRYAVEARWKRACPSSFTTANPSRISSRSSSTSRPEIPRICAASSIPSARTRIRGSGPSRSAISSASRGC
jgi:Tat protein secretion system quality control protein TatD with DNase activity